MITSYKEMKEFKNMSSSQLSAFHFKTNKVYKLENLLSRKIDSMDNGVEVGSVNYIKKSSKVFLKAKALQAYNFFPIITEETFEYIKPSVFYQMHLKEGDIIISKDSNIGEVGILDKDYENVMLSSAFYKLPIKNNKLYIFAFLKSGYFKRQLDILAPKGATIRHAGKRFLECYVPFPEEEEVLEYITFLAKCVMNMEKTIELREEQLIEVIQEELEAHCTIQAINKSALRYSELRKLKRCDVGVFSDNYRMVKNLIEYYMLGSSTLSQLGYEITRGQNLQISSIGKSVYSKVAINEKYYSLILSNSITDNMSFRTQMYLGSPKKLKTMQFGDIIFTCRGNLGRCFINCSKDSNYITNIDNVHISNSNAKMSNKVTVGCFLHYLKKKEYLKNISIQGSGADSFTKYHFDMVKIPNFPQEVEKKLESIYCFENFDGLNMQNFEQEIKKYGLFYLERIKEILRKRINVCFDKIIHNEKIEIWEDFDNLLWEVKNI